MTRRLVFLALAVLTGASLAFLLAGCSEKSTKPNPSDCQDCPVARTSPGNVLADLRIIYSVMDNNVSTPEQAHALAEQYRTLFHPDFKFYFLPADTPPGLPENWWGRNDEVASFDTLHTKRALGIVNEIQLSWTVGSVVPDNRANPNPPPPLLHPDWVGVHVSSILLDVVHGENRMRVSNGLADFYFAPDPADTTLWVITEWWDRQPVSSPRGSRTGSRVSTLGEPTTWGRIKYYYR
jgi:hypothetical protein